MLTPTRFKTISTRRCYKPNKKMTQKNCKSINKQFHTGVTKGILYAARLNIPLLPKPNKKQIVLGTTKNLLPYIVLTKYFKMFVIEASKWTMEKNMNLIECIAKQYIEADIIRFVTTPSELIDPNNNYRVTAQEICLLKKYNFHFYKYNSKEFDNVYFCSKIPLSKCTLVDTSEGAFKCKGKNISSYLYF